MIIKIISDIHLELLSKCDIKYTIEKIIKNTDVDLLVLAGDIGNPFSHVYNQFIKLMSLNFQKTIIISGNHEYYNGNSIEETDEKINSTCKHYNNIHFLNRSSINYKGYNFIGATLWSKIDTNTNNFINDTKCIKDMTITKYNELHEIDKEYILSLIDKKNKNVLVTHHMPLIDLIDPKYEKYKDIKQWFASDLTEIIRDNNITTWIYGHTHKHSVKKYTINDKNVDFICNPIGYKNENKDSNYDYHYILNSEL